jgi:hypothetical protein
MISLEAWYGLTTLTANYWHRVDRICAEPVDELYVENGLMQIESLRCEGREQIRAFFRDRNSRNQEDRRTTRHAVGSLAIESIGSFRFRIRSSVQVMSGIGDWPLALTVPSSVDDFEDIVLRCPRGAWLFVSRSARSVFASC